MVDRQGIGPSPPAVNGKLRKQLDDSLEDFQRRIAAKEANRKRERKKRRSRETGYDEVWLGDPEDEPDDDDDEEYVIYPTIPEQVHWLNFLIRMGWQQRETLWAQPADWVHRNWEVYKFQLVTGLFNRMTF